MSETSDPATPEAQEHPECYWYRLGGKAESAAFQLWILSQSETPDQEKANELGVVLGMKYPVLVESDNDKIRGRFEYPTLCNVYTQMYLRCPVGKAMTADRTGVEISWFKPADSTVMDEEFVRNYQSIFNRPIVQRTPITVFRDQVNPFAQPDVLNGLEL